MRDAVGGYLGSLRGRLTIQRLKPIGLLPTIETMKSLIVKPCLLTLEVFVGLASPGQMGIMTWGESVQPLQSVKLIYQSGSRIRAAWTLT